MSSFDFEKKKVLQHQLLAFQQEPLFTSPKSLFATKTQHFPFIFSWSPCGPVATVVNASNTYFHCSLVLGTTFWLPGDTSRCSCRLHLLAIRNQRNRANYVIQCYTTGLVMLITPDSSVTQLYRVLTQHLIWRERSLSLSCTTKPNLSHNGHLFLIKGKMCSGRGGGQAVQCSLCCVAPSASLKLAGGVPVSSTRGPVVITQQANIQHSLLALTPTPQPRGA